MVFGWGSDPEPDPARAAEAQDRYQRGATLLEDGERDEGLTELERAAEVAGESYTEDGHETRARACLALAGADLDDGEAALARQRLSDAREAGEAAETPDGLALAAEASAWLGDLLSDAQQHDRARQALERAIELASRAQTSEGYVAGAHAAYRLAHRSAEAGDTDAAVDRYREAFELAQQADADHGDRIAAAASLETGRLLRDEGRFAEALEALERATTLADELPGPVATETRTRGLSLIGRVHRDAGDRKSATAAFEEAVERAEGSPSSAAGQMAVCAAWALADLHAEQGAADEVDRWYQVAVDRALAIGDPRGPELAGKVEMACAARRQQAGDSDAASEHYAEAARLGDRADTVEGNEVSRTARNRNVNLASGLADTVEVPRSPDPGPLDPPPVRPGEIDQAQAAPATAPTTGTTDEARSPQAPKTREPSPVEDDEAAEPVDASPEEPAPPAEEPTPSPQALDEPVEAAPETTPDAPEPVSADEPVDQGEAPSSPMARAPPEGARARGALVDRAETLHDLGLKRGNESYLEQAIAMIDHALRDAPRDADLLHRRGRMRSVLAVRRDDEIGLEEALESFARAFHQHGGRVDPTTHKPGPKFFFDWGRATYELARLRSDAELFETAHERLTTGYEMTPRGARHQIAAALMARCQFGRAEVEDDAGVYQQVLDRYEALEIEAPFALAAEDHRLWAQAIAALAEERDDAALYKAAYERARKADERG